MSRLTQSSRKRTAMATTTVDIVRRFLNAIETDNINEIKHHLSGDFILHEGTTQPLNKYQFLKFVVAMKQSFPDLAVQIQSIREDHQLAQSDRVDVDVQITGASVHPSSSISSAQAEEDSSTSPLHGRLSFTIMGEIIESLIIADSNNGELTQLFEQFHSQGKDREGIDASVQKEHDNEDASMRYNRQSNLYDPQGKSYTPSQKDLDAAPQVDAYSISQQQQHEPAPYLFSTEQEQRELRGRQPNRNMEEQEEHS